MTLIVRDSWTRDIAGVWLKLLAVLGVLCAAFLAVPHGWGILERFFLYQDVPIALTSLALFAALALAACRLPQTLSARMDAVVVPRGWLITVCLATLVGALSFLGWRWVYQGYPLSMDEFWAVFDASIFRHGHLMAPVPPVWRPYIGALQYAWRLSTPGGGAWVSTYLPVNAALRALFSLLGSAALTGPVCAAVSVLLVFAVARRLWPARPDAAVVAALLLASSSQVIVAAMSPYAMPAHLAFNLAWLWLFLRKSRWCQGAAVVVAFAATGLHQFVFHPLFAGPFVLQLWAERRWGRAAFHTTAYALICAFWIAWPTLLFATLGFSAEAAARAESSSAAAQALSHPFALIGPSIMAFNLLRLMTWQNPLTIPLALFAARAALGEKRGILRPMAGGIAFAVVFLTVITPWQGHGWGFRYLHGFLGSLCLLAGAGWITITEAVNGGRRRAWAALAGATAVAVCLWLPARLYQVRSFVHPYALATAAINASPAEIVIVDPTWIWYGDDLVRNNPFLNAGPKVLHLKYLSQPRVDQLCATHRVAIFDRKDARLLGIGAMEPDPQPPGARPQTSLPKSCGPHVVQPPTPKI
jgi:hypothetical protein